MIAISLDIIHELFIVDPIAGSVKWRGDEGRVKRGKRTDLVGKEAGVPTGRNRNYIQIEVKIGGRRMRLKAHNVVWAVHHGRWPESPLDHINLNALDNRIGNLREATSAQNAWNQPGKQERSQSGFKWVMPVKWPTGTAWRAEVTAHGKKKRGPYRKTPEKAYSDALEIASRLHGIFSRPTS